MIRAITHSLLLLALPAVLFAATPGPATAPASSTAAPTTQKATSKFLRFADDGPKGARLEASEITYRNAAGVTLRLVSAVHIAEDSYYRDIAKRFEADDAVLYEMVKPRGMAPPRRGEQSDHAVSRFQRFLKDKLNLAFQLDAIDYTRPNFVHADLDAETFQQLQSDRNESLASVMMQSMVNAMANPRAGAGGGDSASQLLTLIAAPDPERQMKLLLAKQFDDIEAAAMGLDGPNGSVILSERNKAAIRALEQTLEQGKRRISIFYGAAHMPDLSRRVEQLGFHPISTQWSMAWDVTIRPDHPSTLVRWFGAATTQPTTRPAPNPHP